ncbi:hypothetical protein AVEN_38092-1 [Araneus ventricosus]|uniref:Uncharacterized protein n=1 Tax=Araneus ventricosus TaxID=182803 RepID=A0A4Y2WVM8_ARAVE|nr:hypothetical protein AVEN_38092-1 [Araneus ventricosus]
MTSRYLTKGCLPPPHFVTKSKNHFSIIHSLWEKTFRQLTSHNHPTDFDNFYLISRLMTFMSSRHILSSLRPSREAFETDPLLALDFLRVSGLMDGVYLPLDREGLETTTCHQESPDSHFRTKSRKRIENV